MLFYRPPTPLKSDDPPKRNHRVELGSEILTCSAICFFGVSPLRANGTISRLDYSGYSRLLLAIATASGEKHHLSYRRCHPDQEQNPCVDPGGVIKH